MSYQDDKRELLKLKQGIIDESESEIHEEEKPVYELHGFKKVENFFYHYKWYVVAGVFFAAVAVFLAVSLLQKEQGDLRVLMVTKDKDIAANVQYKTQEIEQAFELYCPDYDNSGYIHVDVYNVDLSENPDPQYSLAAVTKVTSEIMYGEAQLFVVDSAGAEAVTNGQLSQFVDLSELYPDTDCINGVFLHIKDSGFAVNAQYYEACPDDLYMAVRRVSQEDQNSDRAVPAQKKALEVIDNIVNGYYAGWVDDSGRIYGIGGKEEFYANET
ncbi:MAG: hypothetical protein IK990_21040 [Ruminiclostridium sp.]|nr:hypothetical protein [Ruminiclostridium sp.]